MKEPAWIRPQGWDRWIIADINGETWEATHDAGPLVYHWPMSQYEFGGWIEGMDDAPPDEPVCQCDMPLLMLRGCLCGSIQRYQVPR